MNFPNYKKGFLWGTSCGFVCAALWFAACYFFSKLPAVTDVSVSLALQPWWKLWKAGLVIFIVVATVVGVLAAFRPNLQKKKISK
jgi:hypothetical protein